jgi:hypothetical protein
VIRGFVRLIRAASERKLSPRGGIPIGAEASEGH